MGTVGVYVRYDLFMLYLQDEVNLMLSLPEQPALTCPIAWGTSNISLLLLRVKGKSLREPADAGLSL